MDTFIAQKNLPFPVPLKQQSKVGSVQISRVGRSGILDPHVERPVSRNRQMDVWCTIINVTTALLNFCNLPPINYQPACQLFHPLHILLYSIHYSIPKAHKNCEWCNLVPFVQSQSLLSSTSSIRCSSFNPSWRLSMSPGALRCWRMLERFFEPASTM